MKPFFVDMRSERELLFQSGRLSGVIFSTRRITAHQEGGVLAILCQGIIEELGGIKNAIGIDDNPTVANSGSRTKVIAPISNSVHLRLMTPLAETAHIVDNPNNDLRWAFPLSLD